MKQIKAGEYKKTMCSFCAIPTKACWRSSGLGLSWYACDGHQGELREQERRSDSGHMSEADHQTWGRL